MVTYVALFMLIFVHGLCHDVKLISSIRNYDCQSIFKFSIDNMINIYNLLYLSLYYHTLSKSHTLIVSFE